MSCGQTSPLKKGVEENGQIFFFYYKRERIMTHTRFGLYPNRCTRLSGICIVIFIRRNIVKYRMHTDTIIIRLNVHKNRLSDFLR